MPEINPGTEIAGYRIESVIGRGGMAVVYRAEDIRLGRKVALKLLAPALAENEQFQQRFIRESRLAASLDHPNIVPIYEAGEADGHLFIAMRYVPGSDLKALLSREGALPPARILRLFVQIGDALDAAHLLGLVHRDVKPGNILITSVTEQSGHAHPDHVYLTDFGLTKRTSSLSGSLTGTGHFLGTVDYVSPEQIQGAPVGPSTDIYALGCVLYESLTGRLPFPRDDDAAVLWAHLVEMPPPVSVLRPELAAPVDEVVAKAVAKAPEDRYDSCRDLVRDLEYALSPSMGLPATSGAGGRQAAHRSRAAYRLEGEGGPPDEASAATGATAAGVPVLPEAPVEQDEETVRWVSHPSLPPGALATPAWDRAADQGAAVPDADQPAARGDSYGVDEVADDVADEADGYDEGAGTAVEDDRAGEGDEYDEYPEAELAEQPLEGYEQDEADGYDDDEEEGYDPNGQQAPAGTVGGRGRRKVLVVLGAVALVAVAVLAVLLWGGRQERFVRYTDTGATVPFALSHPESWTPRTGAASDVVIARRPDTVGEAFLSQSPDRWSGTREALGSAPEEATGLYVYTQSSGSDTSTEALQGTVKALLGDGVLVDFGSTHSKLLVGGAEAHEFEGAVSDPKAPGTRLSAVFDVVLPPGGRLALFVFFAAPDQLESQKGVFTKVRDGVTFSG